jgi:TonB family protein
MNRLQKKCVFATVGIHLLLLLILIVGPAFFNPQPKQDDKPLDMIPSTVLDNVLNSGVQNAATPPPVPVVTPTLPAPTPPTPKPVVTPLPKPVEPTPTLTDRIKDLFKPATKPEPAKPEPPKPAEAQTHKIQPNLTPTTRTTPKTTTNPQDNKAVNSALKNLKSKLSKGTTIDMPGESTVAQANYASVVKSVYDAAWTLPDTIAKDENITVKVTIASDGTVISSRIVTPSGDAPADASVQRTLDRVKFIQAFPEGSTDKERTYTINFNPQVKSSE